MIYTKFIFLVFLLISCGKNPVNEQTQELSGTSWKLESFSLSDGNVIYSDGFIIWEEMEKYTVTFSEDSLFGAQISTNHLSGTYQYDLEGNINLTPLSITYINIPADGYSDEYLFALDDANYYELNNNILSLYYNQSSSFLNFLRDE